MKQLKLGLGLCWAVYWVINAMLFVALLSDSEGSPFRTMTLASLLAACYCGMRAFDKFVRLIAELKADGMRRNSTTADPQRVTSPRSTLPPRGH